MISSFNQQKIGIFFIFILFGAIFFVLPVSAATPKEGILNSNSRVRLTAGYTKVLAVLPKKTRISIIGEKKDWYRIQQGKKLKGWVAKWLVDPVAAVKAAKILKTDLATASTTKQSVASSAPIRNAVLLYNSRIRKTPQILVSNINEVLISGTIVKITGQKDDWYSVEYGNSKTGWISCPLVSIMTGSSTVAATSWEMLLATTSALKLAASSSESDINGYWQEKVNGLRKEKGLRELVIDARLQETATKWAAFLAQKGAITHTRPDGKTMHQWIAAQDIEFTKRNSADGWKVNYFSENIGLQYTKDLSLGEMQGAMVEILGWFIKEGQTGPHYQTTFHPDWNSVGVGWMPVQRAEGGFELYLVFHYGSLFF